MKTNEQLQAEKDAIIRALQFAIELCDRYATCRPAFIADRLQEAISELDEVTK